MDKVNFEEMKPMTREDWMRFISEDYELPDTDFDVDRGNGTMEGFNDDVHSPSHYKTFPDAESIDIIKKTLTQREYIGYLKGSVLKYRLRAGKKDDALKDLEKSDWFQGELFAESEERND